MVDLAGHTNRRRDLSIDAPETPQFGPLLLFFEFYQEVLEKPG
jgi:hypothetical protein